MIRPAGFVWNQTREIGFFPVTETWYNNGYFEASERNAKSSLSPALNLFRKTLANKYTRGGAGIVLDFGSGYGEFIARRSNTIGFDICEKAARKLKDAGLFFDPYLNDLDQREIEAVTFFDVIEHLLDPQIILERIRSQYVIVSIPIFRDEAHILGSKHFKIQEHYWYFTAKSFREYMANLDFRLIEARDDETKIGREDIITHVFKR